LLARDSGRVAPNRPWPTRAVEPTRRDGLLRAPGRRACRRRRFRAGVPRGPPPYAQTGSALAALRGRWTDDLALSVADRQPRPETSVWRRAVRVGKVGRRASVSFSFSQSWPELGTTNVR